MFILPTTRYLWSKQHKESLITSQFPEVTYLVALDEDDNILIYSLQKKNKATKIGYQAALVTLISACTFDFEEGKVELIYPKSIHPVCGI